MIKVEVFLKSGQTIKFSCKECLFQYDNASGEFTGYKFVEIKEFEKVSFVPTQIAAYTTKV